MTDHTELVQRLNDASQGHDEWRVQNPEDGAYCIAFAWPQFLAPECEARSWLADHIKRFPNGRFVDYVVACVRVTSEADQLHLEAAAALEQQAAQIADLQLTKSGLIGSLRDEMDEGLRLRELGGALPDENITAMTERIIGERSEQAAQIEALRAERDAYKRDFEAELAANGEMRKRFGALPPDTMFSFLDRLEAEFIKLRADAERYRWLRVWTIAPNLDALIDAALRQEQPKGEGA